MSKFIIDDRKLISEWDYEKNSKCGYDPNILTLGSDKKVWWICSKGHSYQSSISNRSVLGRGCPYCSNTKVLRGYNDMATINPDMANEFDLEKNYPLTPYDILAGSNKKYWWKCSKGHSWCVEANTKKSCPYCSGRYAIPGENDLATTNPSILNCWDYEKNIIKPSEIKEKSSVLIWWKCSKGHSYKKSVAEQTSYETPCPYCSNKKILVGYNDLAHQFPDVLKEWDYEKNIISPEQILGTTQKKVWWKCIDGHSYQMQVYNKTVMNRNCPYCKNQLVLTGYNDIFTTHPYLKEEWDYEKNAGIDPTKLVGGNYKKYWWKCSKGHSWLADINGRKCGNNCPICSSELHTSFGEQAILFYVLKSEYAINRHSDFGREIDIYLPNLKIGIEYNGSFYHKNKKEKDLNKIKYFKEKGIRILSINEGIDNIVDGDEITFCNKRQKNKNLNWAIGELLKIIKLNNIDVDVLRDSVSIHQQYISLEKEQSVGVLYPHLIEEWDEEKNFPLTPFNMRYGSNTKVWWKCSKGHSYDSSISHRVEGKGCPYCQNLKVLKGYNDLKTISPTIASEWHPTKNGKLLPDMIVAHYTKKVWWKCTNGHEWEATPDLRQKYGCPYCSNKRASSDYNLSKIYPNILEEWDYSKNIIKPEEVLPVSHKKVWWKCTNGHSYELSISHRINMKQCPICSGKKIEKGINDLATKHPHLIEEWDYEKNEGINPTMISPGTKKKVWWKCGEGHSWLADISMRTYNNTGCPYCSGRYAIKGVNDLETLYPNISLEWDYSKNEKKPFEYTSKSGEKVWWICSKCGTGFQKRICDRTNLNRGCPNCKKASRDID